MTGPSILQVFLDKNFDDEATDKRNQMKISRQHTGRWKGEWSTLEDKCLLMSAQTTLSALDPYGPAKTCVPILKQSVPIWDIRKSRPKIGGFLDNLAQIISMPTEIIEEYPMWSILTDHMEVVSRPKDP